MSPSIIFAKKKEKEIKSNPKGFFKIVNDFKQDNNLPPVMSYKNQSGTGISEVCDLFGSFFGSVYSQPSNSHNTTSHSHLVPLVDINVIHISIREIFDCLSHLKTIKGPGTDNVPNIFLRNCVFALAKPLYILFNKSLSLGSFPSQWKESRITPIFKSGNKNLVENYRPISIINSIPKLFEKLVTPHLYETFKSFIIEEQHGFVEKKSTVSNLALINEAIISAIDTRKQLDVVYTDFAKAFDKVPHGILIRKLRLLGVNDPLLSWISDYLRDRFQTVNIKGQRSSHIRVTSGVPQGSHLGPLLFIIFINDLRFSLRHSNILLYADDAKIYKLVESQADAELLQNDLISFEKWCADNHMLVNVSKCLVVRYTKKKSPLIFNYKLQETTLKTCEEVKDLGVTFSDNGSFHSHIISTTNKALRILGFIFRNLQFFNDPSTLQLLFNSLVRPLLEYGSPVWTPSAAKDKKLLESVQTKFLRRLAWLNKTPMRFDDHDYTYIRNQFKVSTLESRRIVADLTLLYKTLNNEIDCPALLAEIGIHVPARRPRLNYLFAVPYKRSDIAENSLVCRLSKLGNEICNDIDFFHVPLFTFIQFLKNKYLL